MTDTSGESGLLVSMSTCLYNDVSLYKRSLEFTFGYIKRKADDETAKYTDLRVNRLKQGKKYNLESINAK